MSYMTTDRVGCTCERLVDTGELCLQVGLQCGAACMVRPQGLKLDGCVLGHGVEVIALRLVLLPHFLRMFRQRRREKKEKKKESLGKKERKKERKKETQEIQKERWRVRG